MTDGPRDQPPAGPPSEPTERTPEPPGGPTAEPASAPVGRSLGHSLGPPLDEPRLRPPRHQVDSRAVRLWTVHAALTALVVVVLIAGAAALIEPARIWLLAATAVAVVGGVAYVVAMPRIRYRVHRWEVTDDAVYTKAGWLTHEWRVAPLSRVQTVDSRRGPLQQAFGLSSVRITTASAAGDVVIDGLDHALAADLVDRLTERTQATPGDANVSAGGNPQDQGGVELSPRAPVEVPWRRLDGRMIAVDVTRLAGSLVPLGIAVLLRNADAGAAASTLTTLAMIGAAGALFDLLRWATTRYRITGARVEVRTGLVTRRHRSIPRDRIRRVDATAKVLHRVFSLQVVTIATGDRSTSSDDELKLDAVTEAAAAEMRHRLLGSGAGEAAHPRLDGAAEAGVWVAGTPAPGTGEGEVLATLNWRWAPYDLLSFWTLAIPALAVAGLLQLLQSIGITVDEVADDARVTGRLRDLSLAAGIALAITAVLVVGVIGALGWFVETWWGFRLVREQGGRLRIRRGLLTTRSISLDEARLRGVEVTENLALRTAGGARLRAVTTGLAGADSSRGEGADVLVPPGPTGEAHRVAAAVLGEQSSPTARVDLRPHPPAARRRRLTRAVAAGAVAFALTAAVDLATDGAPQMAWAVPAAVTLAAVAYALDAYRSLGHGLTGRYLVVRRGSLARRTVVLQRAGVIGWNVRRTVFQRRLGLATIVVTTAAGNGSYTVADVAVGDGLHLADEAVPGLLAPFLDTPTP